MRLALLPGLFLALAAVGWSGLHAHTSYASTLSGIPGAHPALFSVAAQTTTTATLTTSATQPVTSTTAVTSTGTVTSTQTVSGTVVAQTTPVPLETATPTPPLQLNPLNWAFLTSPAPNGLGAFGPFSWIYLVLMLALLGAGTYFYFVKRPQWKRTNTVYRRAAERFAPAAMWLAAITIALMLARVVEFPFLNLRFWLYLSFVALIALAIWFYYWYSRSLPVEMEKYRKTQRAKQYMPSGKKGSSRPAQAVAPRPSTPARTTETTTTASGQAPGTPRSGASRPGGSGSSKKRKKR